MKRMDRLHDALDFRSADGVQVTTLGMGPRLADAVGVAPTFAPALVDQPGFQPDRFMPKPTGPFARERGTNARVELAFDTYTMTDPEMQSQWHLGMLGDLQTVWKDYTGKGVSVGIYDSGTQYEHWDLAANYDASKHVVIDGVAIDGFANSTEAHGTAVGGIIAAARNGQGGVGIAYDASITGINIFGPEEISVNGGARFLDAMRQATRYDVVNHSWGSGPDYRMGASRTVAGNFQYDLTEAVRGAAQAGRDGLGTISVFAAGNNSLDGVGEASKSDRHQIAVAAYREIDGNATVYSTRGANILVAAPSNDYRQLGGRGTVATDIMGTAGYNIFADQGGSHDYTDTFGGTSSAAPKVAAVVALMLDANEGLGWRDVHGILASSSRMPVAYETGVTWVSGDVQQPDGSIRVVDRLLNNSSFELTGSQANWNGGKMHFSNDYGYGAVDAHAAVRMAEVWSLFGPAKTSANETSLSGPTVEVGLTSTASPGGRNTADTLGNSFVGTPQRITFEMGGGIDLEHADMTIRFTSRYVIDPDVATAGDDAIWSNAGLKIKLTAPDGSTVFVDTDGAAALPYNLGPLGPIESFTFGFANLRHVDSEGTWTMEFEQVMPLPGLLLGIIELPYIEAETTIHSLKMDLYGSAPTNNDVHHYTDEFFTMLAIEGETSRRTLADTNGGTDWINAAAVTSDINLSLEEGVRTTFGGRTAFTIAQGSLIEGAVTGDGNDRLIGNALDNKLYGMRGDDWLNGGAGNDTLFGGQGNDVFAFDTAGVSGRDTVLDWSAGDRIATSKMLRGADQNGVLTVASNALLLLDGTMRGDTAELDGQGGATLQALGRSNGYWWYGFLSEGDENFVDGRVTELALGQTGRPEGGVPADAATAGTATFSGTTGVTLGGQGSAFFLYDAMGDAMASGVQIYA